MISSRFLFVFQGMNVFDDLTVFVYIVFAFITIKTNNFAQIFIKFISCVTYLTMNDIRYWNGFD